MHMSALHTLWPIWIIAFVLAVAGKHESVSILSGLPWWHRVIGTAAAMMFYGAHLGLLK
jgi:hypothetical protein